MPIEREQLRRSDETLLVRLSRHGDRAAFAEIVRRREPWLRNLMRRLCGQANLADDLAQDAFFTAWRAVPTLESPERFAAWLKRIAINTWLQHARRRDPLREPESLEDTSARQGSAGLRMDLDRALGELADDARLCVVLAYHESMTHDEISALTGLPLGTVKSHVRRGAEKLRGLLDAYAGGASE